MQRFDLVIIGTGSGNSLVTPDFDAWRIAIVEEGVFGGTCLNRGCIPTKMLVQVADLAESIRHAGGFGIDATIDALRWRDIRDRVFNRIDPIAAGGEEYRTHRCPNVTVFRGRGSFVGPKQVRIGSEVIEGDRIVIAAGGRPMIPDIPGLDAVPFHTSDDIMRVDEVPRRLVVIGGGFIACELAHVFGAFGSRITIVHRGEVLLRHEDHDVSTEFTKQFRARFDVRMPTQVQRVGRTAGGALSLELSDGSLVEADAVLVATGRVPNTDTLDVAATGVEMHGDGRVRVNARQETTVPGIWALGDISSDHLLKHVANHEARTVAHNLAHPDAPVESDHRFVPHAVFTRPQIASVGKTEAEARAAGIDVRISVRNYGDTAYGWALEDTSSFCKLVADAATRKLVGAHILGPHAGVMIQQLIQGMSFGQTVDELARNQYYIHPALPEVVENALLGIEW